MNDNIISIFIDKIVFSVERGISNVSNAFKKVSTFLTVSSIFVGFTGFFQTFAGYILLGIVPSLMICLVVFLITFSVYSLNKLTDQNEDAINMPERQKFLKDKNRLILYVALLAYAFSMLIASMQKLSDLLIILIPPVANAIYSLRLLPGIPRFKDIPVMKNLFVALSWALVCTLMPASQMSELTVAVAFVIYFMLARVFINTAIFDIRDVEGDSKNGIRTLPVLLGSSRTTVILLAINSTLLPWLWLFGSAKALAEIMVAYGYAIILYFRKRRNPLALDLFVDGEWMIACIAFLLLRAATRS